MKSLTRFAIFIALGGGAVTFVIAFLLLQSANWSVVVALLISLVLFTTIIHPQAPKVAPIPTPAPQVTLNCAIGSEKADLMRDANVKRILSQKYGITFNFKTQSSLDQATLTTNQLKQQRAGLPVAFQYSRSKRFSGPASQCVSRLSS